MCSYRNALLFFFFLFFLEQLVLIALPWHCCESTQQSASLAAAVNNHTAEARPYGFVQGTRAKETALIKLCASLCCQLVGCRQL